VSAGIPGAGPLPALSADCPAGEAQGLDEVAVRPGIGLCSQRGSRVGPVEKHQSPGAEIRLWMKGVCLEWGSLAHSPLLGHAVEGCGVGDPICE
jgi:hypothetical protein